MIKAFIVLLGLVAPFALGQGEFLFFDFPSPETLSVSQIQDGVNQRKLIWRDFILGRPAAFETVPVFIANNASFDFDSLVQPVLDALDEDIDPDFRLMTLVRILFLTEDFNTEILTAISGIKLWLTQNEGLRIYWTENHQIMYSAAAYLLRQKFGEEAFPPGFFDENLDTRLDWFLRTKVETGFFEFSSPIYYQFTTAGLLLLHDFADNSTIREQALECLLTGVEEWMPIVSSEGVVTHAASRAFQFFYFPDSDMFGNGAQQVIAFLTGLGPLIVTSARVRAVTAALVLTNADLSPAIATFRPQQFNIRQFGLADTERDAIFGQLPGFERNLAQITMGLFADPSTINDLFDFLSFFNLFGREDFSALEAFAILQGIPDPQARIAFAKQIESIGTGSSYYVPEYVSYKDLNVVMTSCNDYFPGFKGYQQFPNIAAISTAAVFTFAMAEELFFDRQNGRTQLLGNNQIPYLRQKQNVLVAIYNPRRDLPVFEVNLEVLFYFDGSLFDEVVNNGNWVFGSLNSAFVGVYREQCVVAVTSEHQITACNEEVQVWITVVGTEASHQSFSNFQASLQASDITIQRSSNCGSAVGSIDGEDFSELFCQGAVDIDTGGNDDEDDEDSDGLDIIQLVKFAAGIVIALLSVLCICYAVSRSKKRQDATCQEEVAVSAPDIAGVYSTEQLESLSANDEVRLPSGNVVRL